MKRTKNAMIDHISRTAVSAARAAGRIQAKHFGAKQRVLTASEFDLTLEIDRHCQTAVIETIRRTFPDHAIVSEEHPPINRESEFIWFVDPLDGTINFFHGLRHFCTCVACYRKKGGPTADDEARQKERSSLGEPVVGVVYAPMLDELYIGIPGCLSTCNGRPIIPADPAKDLSQAIVGISFGKDEAAIKKMEKLNAALVRRVRKVRMFGSTGLDIANVAMGRISALALCSVHEWDFAASSIILEQSGGRFYARKTEANRWEMVASSETVFEPLRRLVGDAWK